MGETTYEKAVREMLEEIEKRNSGITVTYTDLRQDEIELIDAYVESLRKTRKS